MTTFQEFEQSLRHVLAHFHDPAYQPPKSLWSILDYRPQREAVVFQDTIRQSIKSLKPARPDTSISIRHQRFYELLTYRYIQQLTQEETAERLGISPRHVRREQQQAIHVLASRLWENKPDKPLSPANDVPLEEGSEQKTTAWRSQVREELASLQQSAPGSVVEVGTALQGIIKIGEALTSQHGVSLKIEPIKSDANVAMHLSALRQVLITAIEKLVQSISAGQITLEVESAGDHVYLIMSGIPAATNQPPNSDLIREILAVHGGSIEAYLKGNRAGFRIELPTVNKMTVLVIDDNEDLVHFYQRYTAGTRYQIVHLAEGQDVLETVEDTRPDVIVLDVMLPDIDGWELLTDLRNRPASQKIPVIVCSVIRRAELALSLGASLYIAKPVRRRQFVEALDQVLG